MGVTCDLLADRRQCLAAHARPYIQPPPPPTPPPQSLKDFLLQNEENKAIREAEKQKRWAEDAEYQKKWQEQLDRQERERLARCGGVGGGYSG